MSNIIKEKQQWLKTYIEDIASDLNGKFSPLKITVTQDEFDKDYGFVYSINLLGVIKKGINIEADYYISCWEDEVSIHWEKPEVIHYDDAYVLTTTPTEKWFTSFADKGINIIKAMNECHTYFDKTHKSELLKKVKQVHKEIWG